MNTRYEDIHVCNFLAIWSSRFIGVLFYYYGERKLFVFNKCRLNALTHGCKFTLNFVLNIVSIPSSRQEMLQNGEIIASIRFAGKMDRFRRLTSVLSVKRSTTLNITRFPDSGVISKVSRNYIQNLKLLQIRSLRNIIIENCFDKMQYD